jgi:hypothetical protein
MPVKSTQKNTVRQGPRDPYTRISPDASWTARRVAAVLVSIWIGGIVMVALTAPASFGTVEPSLAAPAPAVAKVIKAVGPAAARDALRYQVAEVNRAMFDLWGWIQLGLGVAVFGLLLFASTVGRVSLAVALAMMALAAVMRLVLIPRIVELTREIQSAGGPGTAGKLQLLHGGYSAFQFTVVVLGAALLVLLLRGRGAQRAVKGRGLEGGGG